MANTPARSVWLHYYHQKPQAQVRLFCFPYAGGGASIFRTWQGSFPSFIEVCPVQLPGREYRLTETAFSQLDPLIEALAAALLPYLNMPYAFFGHSMGAVISFELVRYLRRIRHDRLPIHLFVSAHRAPQCPPTDPPTYHLPDPEFIEELRRLEGTSEEVLRNEELLQLLLPLLRADFALVQQYTYRQEEKLNLPITAFGGLYDESVPQHTIGAWQEQTSRAFRQRFFPRGHFFLQQEQASLTGIIAQQLYSFAAP